MSQKLLSRAKVTPHKMPTVPVCTMYKKWSHGKYNPMLPQLSIKVDFEHQ